MAVIFDGKALCQRVKDDVKAKVAEFSAASGRKIKLAVVLVGENPASRVYVKNKIKAAEYVGIESLSFNLPETTQEAEVAELVKGLAEDDGIDAVLVQLPLPEHINEQRILDLIPPEKDVDGFSDINVGKLTLGKPCIAACTPSGIIEILKSAGITLQGKHAVIVGRSNIVGKPAALLLLRENCTVTICHSKTKNLAEICRSADILVAAVGRAGFITGEMIKDGAAVIDVGINRTENGLKGDVEFESAAKKASFITPVPGGVGPMTIAMLMKNAYICAERRNEKNGL